jgi:NADPH:quinone reductase-like Zn-dependent oxidoreductase
MMEHRFPLIPGMDASGTVDALGEGVEGWSVGDDVFGSVGKTFLGEGTLAEYATMSVASVVRKPGSIDHAAAAAVPVAGVTAWLMVEAIDVSEGNVVLAIGASGGVGSYLLQLAANRGARVVAVCSVANAEYARSLGAIDVIDYAASDVIDTARSRFPGGVDAVADMHGGDVVDRLAEQIRDGGRVVSAVGAADPEVFGPRGIESSNVMGNVTSAHLESLVAMLESGELKTPQLNPFSLAEAGRAIEVVGSGHVRGKVIVIPS